MWRGGEGREGGRKGRCIVEVEIVPLFLIMHAALFELLMWPHEVEPWFHSWYRGRDVESWGINFIIRCAPIRVLHVGSAFHRNCCTPSTDLVGSVRSAAPYFTGEPLYREGDKHAP